MKPSPKVRKTSKTETIIFEESGKDSKKYSVDINPDNLIQIKFQKRKYRFRNREPIPLFFIVEIPNEVILKPNKKYTLIINYPLQTPFEKEFVTSKDGMTLSEVMKLAIDSYKKIYRDEKKTSTLKEESILQRTKGKVRVINRAETNGKYGIWGHELGDLGIHSVIVKGDTIYLGVDS